MKETNSLITFLDEVKNTQQLWALQDKESEDWVVLDSINYEKTEVMPLWSSEALAAKHCVDEWKNYSATAITVADWLEYWVDDLLKDEVVIGINWLDEDNDIEVDLSEFTHSLAEVETL